MKLLFFFFSFFSIANVLACPEFENIYTKFSNRSMINIDEWGDVTTAFSNCGGTAVKNQLEDLKQIRIKTLESFRRNGIKEEGGAQVLDLLSHLNNTPIERRTPVSNQQVPLPDSSATTAPANCRYIKLENEVINENTVKDQGSLSWCYAIVASEMAAYRLNTPLSFLSFHSGKSAISDELRIPEHKGDDTSVSMEVAYQRLKGYCRESSLPSAKLDLRSFKDLGELLKYMTDPNSQKLYCFKDDIKKVFPYIDVNFLLSNAGIAQKLYIEDLIAKHCQRDKIIRPEIKVKCFTPENSKDFLAQIDHELYTKNLPVGYAFRASDMLNESRQANHGALIVGKVFNEKTNKCDYIIRNSWGKTCRFKKIGKGEYCMRNSMGYTGYLQFPPDILEQYLLGIYKYTN